MKVVRKNEQEKQEKKKQMEKDFLDSMDDEVTITRLECCDVFSDISTKFLVNGDTSLFLASLIIIPMLLEALFKENEEEEEC